VIGGFSSGGDLAYRTAFYNSTGFAGLLAVGTTPFRDTGSTQQASIAASTFKFHVVHLAHTEDEIYPIATVRQETDALTAAGFPVERVERPGSHYDEQTDANLQAVLLPHMADDWLSP
jgi:predicted esterase